MSQTRANTLGGPQDYQARVRVYLSFLLFVDVFAHVSDIINPLIFEFETPALTGFALILRWCVSVFTACSVALVWLVRFPLWASIATEVGVTVGLSRSYVVIAMAYQEDSPLGPIFALMGIMMLLVVRASLIPSTLRRTALVGVTCLVVLFWGGYGRLQATDPTVIDGVVFMGVAFVSATVLISRVIYGLRQRVEDMKQLGQYVLERKIGEGGMGIVYQASHGMLRRPTAVKLLPPSKAGTESIERFEREVQLTAKLTHPNTVTIFDYGRTPEGIFYYAMEMLHGPTLEQVVALTGRQPQSRTRDIIQACADALHEAHDVSLIHRDVKPSNIILCQQGYRSDVVKLLDFGLVKQLDRDELDPNLTTGTVVVGTPMYMSPEAIRAPNSVDGRSDLYALGAVAFYLLTGQDLFPGGSAIEVCSHHLQTEPDTPSQRASLEINPEFEALIMACLSKDPDARPSSAAELSDKLADIPLERDFQSQEWWEEYGPALDKMLEEQRASVSGRTIAIAPR